MSKSIKDSRVLQADPLQAKKIEFELMRELAKRREEKIQYRWGEWFEKCLNLMKMELRPSTVTNYDWQIKKWLHPHWEHLEVRTLTKSDVYSTIFEKCSEIPSRWRSKKGSLIVTHASASRSSSPMLNRKF